MNPVEVSRACPTKRRGRKEMATIREEIADLLREDHPMTCRQVFYRLVSAGAIEKTEQEYKGTVLRLLKDMRMDGTIEWSDIVDSSRWRRKPDSWGSLTDALKDTQNNYRRALWQDQDTYVEIWSEKDAIAGVLYEATRGWDVPLMTCKGFPSLSYLHGAAEVIDEQGKDTFIYYFGDHDPSGVLIDPKIAETIRDMLDDMGSDVEIVVERVAVLPEQIEEWGLPTRPTKKKGTHVKSWKHGDSVEVDAIPPAKLRELCRECIVQHVDQDQWRSSKLVERAEKETLEMMIARGLGGAA